MNIRKSVSWYPVDTSSFSGDAVRNC